MLKFIFWLFLFLIIYTYFIYPLILRVLLIFYKKEVKKKDITPTVSLIIAAHNEELNIREKIENSLNLDYPKDKIEIIVASDSSSDNTDNIVSEYENRGVILVRLEKRGGKTIARNNAVNSAKKEILVFSDAPTIYRKDAIKKLVRNYKDESIGCVSGNVIYINETESPFGEGGSLYWKYERWLKEMESSIGSILGTAGCIYSMRKELYMPFEESKSEDSKYLPIFTKRQKSLDDDFLNPTMVYLQNYRSVFEPEAISFEKTSTGRGEEFRMRSRVITRALSGLLHIKQVLNPFKHPKQTFQLVSHKILRWMVPFSLIFVFASNLALLEYSVYRYLFILQCLFYTFAIFGYVTENNEKLQLKIFYIPYYFCVVNMAVLTGIINYFIGKRNIIWTPER